MDPLFLGVAAVAVVALVTHFSFTGRKRRDPRLVVFDELGLRSRVAGAFVWGEGPIDGLDVFVELHGAESYGRAYSLVRISPVIPDLYIEPKGNAIDWIADRFAGEAKPTPTGDPDFDRVLLVRGSTAAVFAGLGAAAREALASELPRIGSTLVDKGCLRYRIESEIVSPKRLHHLLRELLALAEKIRAGKTPTEALAKNATTDPIPLIRRSCLEVLANDFAGEPATETALAAAVRDPDPHIALAAASRQKDGVSRLEQLVLGAAVLLDVRLQALEVLFTRVPAREQARICDLVIPIGPAEISARAIRHLGELSLRGRLPELRRLAAQPSSLDAALADALGMMPDAGSEPALLAILARGDHAARLAAARALGECGTALAVPALHGAHGSLLDREMTRVCEDAVLKIQQRLEGATAGQLALADAPAGGDLSLTGADPDTQGGALSLPEDATRPSKPASSGSGSS